MTSQEEKIDYIYERLKKQEDREKRDFFLKWGFRIFIVLYLLYLYKVTLPVMKENFIESIKPNVSLDTEKIKDFLDF